MNLVTLILLDKGYFDYDYEKVDPPKVVTNWEDTIKTQDEVSDILSMFGMAPKKAPSSLEEIQSHIIKQMEEE